MRFGEFLKIPGCQQPGIFFLNMAVIPEQSSIGFFRFGNTGYHIRLYFWREG